ncbi:formimidoylglutamase [Robertkochia flava]|uniref:formimidoylglutamase n=1 Tax=Robertkochia flava TaxID=3447986 RepID=UPI001CCD0E2A|nr:formimidoylglutamase [Robertkochia marina]
MPSKLITYDLKKIHSLTKIRAGETKFGEKTEVLNSGGDLEEQLQASGARFVLFGIPEDIGVMGNHGQPGTRYAWEAALKAILNMQHNAFTKGSKVLVLGHLDFSDSLKSIEGLSGEERILKCRSITEGIDKEVTDLVRKIVSSGKKPIIIGGGHNNAYGNIKGSSLALGLGINVLNIDAHTDFRKRESRHSGNGFSWAYYEGFLDKYFMFGIHENYTSKKIFKKIDQEDRIAYNTFEELFIRREKGLEFEINESINFVKGGKFGLEVDMDAIAYMPSSAHSPCGLSLETVRQMVFNASRSKNATYLHLCEAAPDPDNPKEMALTGKALAYLVSDFIRK